MDLSDIAERLDAEEKLELIYRFPVKGPDGQTKWETRHGRLLDVAEEAKLFYVSHDGGVIWVKEEEAIDVRPAQT